MYCRVGACTCGLISKAVMVTARTMMVVQWLLSTARLWLRARSFHWKMLYVSIAKLVKNLKQEMCTMYSSELSTKMCLVVFQEVQTAIVDLDEVRAYRNCVRSRTFQAAKAPAYPRVKCNFAVTSNDPFLQSSPPIQWQYHTPEEEIRFSFYHLILYISIL